MTSNPSTVDMPIKKVKFGLAPYKGSGWGIVCKHYCKGKWVQGKFLEHSSLLIPAGKFAREKPERKNEATGSLIHVKLPFQ